MSSAALARRQFGRQPGRELDDRLRSRICSQRRLDARHRICDHGQISFVERVGRILRELLHRVGDVHQFGTDGVEHGLVYGYEGHGGNTIVQSMT